MSKIKVKTIQDEDFVDYQVPAMLVAFSKCDFKCGKDVCQNAYLAKEPDMEVDTDDIVKRYMANDITEAVVFAGLDPFCTPYDVLVLVQAFRKYTNDPIVIYTGFSYDAVKGYCDQLKHYANIIVKFGKYLPNRNGRYDAILGVKLSSVNQYALKIS